MILSTEPILGAHLFDAQRLRLTSSPPDGFSFAVSQGSNPSANGNGHAAHTPVVLHSLDVGEAERALIVRALEVSRGNRTRAADLLGINVRTLRNKLNRK